MKANHTFTDIAPGNDALEYLEKRVTDVSYRGSSSSQHNRYTMDQAVDILSVFYEFAGKSPMRLRTTDMRRRPYNTPEETMYANFCDKAKLVSGIGTQDSMRKNLFVDWHRMGLINRYDAKEHLIYPQERKNVVYASLTAFGLRFINPEVSRLDKQIIFSKAVNNLLKGFIDVLLTVFIDYPEIRYITTDEFIFFLSAVKTDLRDEFTFSIYLPEAIMLIQAYGRLSMVQKQAVIDRCSIHLVPDQYTGNKKDKKDFHNWKNKTQQIFWLLSQTSHFMFYEADREKICLRFDTDQSAKGSRSVDFKRSAGQKQQYFELHGLHKKERGFELHHVVPLSLAESIDHFTLLDDYRNLVYIDGYSHAMITQNRSRNVHMSNSDKDLILTDYDKKDVYLEFKKNVYYDPVRQRVMLDYNKELIKNLH